MWLYSGSLARGNANQFLDSSQIEPTLNQPRTITKFMLVEKGYQKDSKNIRCGPINYLVQTENTLLITGTQKYPEDHGKQLWWMTEEFPIWFPCFVEVSLCLSIETYSKFNQKKKKSADILSDVYSMYQTSCNLEAAQHKDINYWHQTLSASV